MPNLKVYGESVPESSVFLRLKPHEDGTVVLYACNGTGVKLPSGNLLHIDRNGSVTRLRGVSKSLGFELSRGGMLVINDEDE